MDDWTRSTAYQRLLTVVAALTLLGALGGGVILVLHAGRAPVASRADFAIGTCPGTVTLRSGKDADDRPLTEPVVVIR